MDKTRKNRKSIRLDQAVFERGLAETIEKAQALVMAGRILVDGNAALKAGHAVSIDSDIYVSAVGDYVSRGGVKLAYALDYFGINLEGKVALDVGASTGGFTDCMLSRGAQRVFALDAGYGQFHYTLRSDNRVTVMERTNARYPFSIGSPVFIATVDVSFISVTKLIHSIAFHVEKGGYIIILVKPQFEARKLEVGRGGVVKDPVIHAKVLGRTISWIVDNGFRFRNLVPSVITGDRGNQEYFILVQV